MKRSIKIMLGLVGLSCSVSRAAEEPLSCVHAATHDRVTILLVDRTDLMRDQARFKQLMTVLRQSTKPNERMIAAVITAHANSSRLLLDLVKPASSAWKSVLKSRKEMKVFNQCLDQLEVELTKQTEKHKNSAILETLAFASEVLQGDPSSRKRIILYSDMLQNSGVVSFYNKSINTKSLLLRAAKNGLLKDLSNVELFFVTNSGTMGEKKDRDIEHFWRSYALSTNSTVRLYGAALTNVSE